MTRKTWWLAVGICVSVAIVAAIGLGISCGPNPKKTVEEPASADSSPAPSEESAAGMGGRTRTVVRRPVDRGASPKSGLPCAIRFQEMTEESGIGFGHTDGSSGRRYIVESMSAGVATFDYDGDGQLDIYFPNGAPLPGAPSDPPPRHALYRNLGGWRFGDVTEAAGVGCRAYGLGIAIGDYNRDGRPDLYLNNFGPNVLYRNNGDGTFTDVTGQAKVARGDVVGAGVCFLDIDGNGTLDLYVGNYIALDLGRHVPRRAGRFPSYPSPVDYAAVPDTLYRNSGDGTFADISRESGIAPHAGRSMGITCADYDDDGATDVFVCNDVQENFLFHNDGHGKFVEVGLQAGTTLNGDGEILANMGVDAGDYDRDGRLDFFTTNYEGQRPVLFRNLGRGAFEDVSRATGAGTAGAAYVNWGCALADFDNDGYPDLFIANGHTEDNIEARDPNARYRCTNLLMRNQGNGQFVDVSEECGLNRLPPHAARGAAVEDLDNDGDLDLVVLNSRERPSLLRNLLVESGSAAHWLQISLEGVKTNRDGVGARVRVTVGGRVQIDEVHSGRGYQSHFGSRLHFGLGNHPRAERIEIRWIGGGVDTIEDVPADRHITIVEGAGIRKPQPPAKN